MRHTRYNKNETNSQRKGNVYKHLHLITMYMHTCTSDKGCAINGLDVWLDVTKLNIQVVVGVSHSMKNMMLWFL